MILLNLRQILNIKIAEHLLILNFKIFSSNKQFIRIDFVVLINPEKQRLCEFSNGASRPYYQVAVNYEMQIPLTPDP